MVSEKERLLEDNTGATKGVDNGDLWTVFVSDRQIEYDLGEFGWQHANAGVAGGPDLITGGIGVDVLNGASAGDKGALSGADNDKFDAVRARKLVVGNLSGVEFWLLIGDDSDAAVG